MQKLDPISPNIETYIKSVEKQIAIIIENIKKSDELQLKEIVEVNKMFIAYKYEQENENENENESENKDKNQQVIALFELYKSLLTKVQKNDKVNISSIPEGLKRSLLEKIKSLINSFYSKEFKEYIGKCDEETILMLTADYGLDDKDLMAKYRKIALTGLSSLATNFKNFLNSFWSSNKTNNPQPVNDIKTHPIGETNNNLNEQQKNLNERKQYANGEEIFLNDHAPYLDTLIQEGHINDESHTYLKETLKHLQKLLNYMLEVINYQLECLNETLNEEEFKDYQQHEEFYLKAYEDYETCKNNYLLYLEQCISPQQKQIEQKDSRISTYPQQNQVEKKNLRISTYSQQNLTEKKDSRKSTYLPEEEGLHIIRTEIAARHTRLFDTESLSRALNPDENSSAEIKLG